MSIIFSPEEPLEPNTEYNIKANVSMLKLVEDEWVIAQNMNDSLIIEEKVSSFTTGDAVNCIKPQHILCSYPIDRMYNLYSKETNTGYICLSENYRFLLNKIPEGYTQKLRLSTKDGIYQDIDFTHFKSTEIENQKYEINFDLSKLNFDNQKIYKLQILQIPTNGNSSETKQIWSIDFRTSKYNTFKEKIDDIFLDGNVFIDENVYLAGHTEGILIGEHWRPIAFGFETWDYFDSIEIHDDGINDNLVCFKADLENTEWFKNSLLYELYHNYKEEADLERIVNTSVTIAPRDYKRALIGDDVFDKYGSDGIWTIGQLIYDVNYVTYYELNDFRNDIMNLKLRGEVLNEYEKKICEFNNLNITQKYTTGNYPFYILYRLPGKNIITSEIYKILVYNE